MNEFMLTVSEKRRERLIELSKEWEAQAVQTALQQTQTSAKSGPAQTDMMGGTVKKKNKKNDKDAQAKKVLQQWQDMYRRTKLTEDELDVIRAGLNIKGVSMRRMNPKGLTIDELFGTFDKESHEWYEGLFS
jgi:tRNA C32,U32 (ribose-2'-O)-methylase TrmJ